jgi:hypothetical protein
MLDASGSGGGRRAGVLLLAGVAIVLLAVSNQSFWIDETLTGWKACVATLQGWWRAMVEERASDLQMPLYMIFMWAWEKVAGHGEWSFRAANALWFLPGLLAIDRATNRWMGCAVAVALLSSPFAWYYLDEARPYAMQLGSALLVAAALIKLRRGFSRDESPSAESVEGRETRNWTAVLVVGAVLLAGSSLLGLVWLGAGLLLLLLLGTPRKLFRWGLRHWGGLSVGGACTVGLGAYYLWSLSIGARATAVATTDLRTTVFVFYELLGFSGLGPGRTQLRADGASALLPYSIPLALYGLLVAAVAAAGLGWIWRTLPRRSVGVTTGVLMGAMLFLLGVGVATHFRVLGRHFTPVWPAVGLVLGAGLWSCWQTRAVGWKMVAAAFIGACLVSSMSFRWGERHRKDAYREAALLAQHTIGRGGSVWWSAEKSGAEFYGLKVGSDPESGRAAYLIVNPEAGAIDNLPGPRLVVASKPDLYDMSGTLAAYLSTNGYQKASNLPGFVVWGKQ